MGVDQTHSDPREAGKGGMHSVVCQDLAVDAVIGCGWNRAYEVGRVDVLHVCFLEALFDLGLQPGPHIFQNGVATEVCLDVT